MASPAPETWTLADYLAYEADRVGQKPNYEWDGLRPIAMSGVSHAHALVQNNLSDLLSPQLRRRGCRSLTADMRLAVGRSRYRYPDLLAYCPPADLTDEAPPSLRNPILLVEVLSPSTSSVDMREKLLEYRSIDSLLEYWIVATDSPYLLRYDCSGQSLIAYPYKGLDVTFESETLGVTVALADVFADLEFDSEG
jgi:Uma2 family endonuclease